MKKIIVLFGCAFVLGIVGAVKLSFNYDGSGAHLLNINVEALANGEGSGGGCYGTGSFVCDHGKYYGRYY